MAKQKIELKPDEIIGMEFYSGYKRYYVFGRDPGQMFREILKMYNSYAGTKYNMRTFRKPFEEEEMSCFMYKFKVSEMISFDDDCYSLGSRNGIDLGKYYMKGE